MFISTSSGGQAREFEMNLGGPCLRKASLPVEILGVKKLRS